MKFYNETRLNYLLKLLVLPNLKLSYSAVYNHFTLTMSDKEAIIIHLEQNSITFSIKDKEIIVHTSSSKVNGVKEGIESLQKLLGTVYITDNYRTIPDMFENAIKYNYMLTLNLMKEGKDFEINESSLYTNGSITHRLTKPLVYYDGDIRIIITIAEKWNGNINMVLFNNNRKEENEFTPKEYYLVEHKVKNLGRIETMEGS